MNKKINNLYFLISYILISVLLILFNYFIDPYGLGKEKIKKLEKLNLNSVPKDMIYTYVNKTKDVNVEVVSIGTSSAYSLFYSDLFHCYTANKIAILSLPELSSFEIYNLLKYFLEVHPEVKQVYVAVDVNTYFYNLPNKNLPKNPTNLLQDFIKLYYSIDVSKLSIKKILSYFQKKLNNQDDMYYVNTKRKYFYHEDINDCIRKNIIKLKDINSLLLSKNINATYFFSPLHSLYLSNMYMINQLDKVENLKREFAKITPFYDMAYINRHTKEPFQYFWVDVIHPTPFINDKVYDVLVYKQPNSEIAVFVDSKNIEEVLKQQRKLIEKYIVENSAYVEEYVNSNLTEVEVESYGELRKKPNLPPDCSLMDKCIVEYMGRF